MPRPLPITSFPPTHHRRALVLAVVALLVAVWVLLPVARAVQLVETGAASSIPAPPPDLAARSVTFRASDGVKLRGWWVAGSPRAASVILVAGFKASRVTMLPYARFLHRAGLNVLLYDSRGTGTSSGSFTLGEREVDDVRGAVGFVQHRPGLRLHRVVLLGVSLGAGVAIAVAAQFPAVRAVVADSAYTDQSITVDRLDRLQFRGVTLPLAPLAPWTVDRLLPQPLATFSPLRAVSRLAPRALFLIHSRHDTNPTTPLSGVQRLFAAAHTPKELWIAPHGGHAGAYAAQPTEYVRRVLAFIRRYGGK